MKEENLVIVESPAKAKTIEKFLGEDFLVMSSFGHIRDLDKKDFGIDLNNNYTPRYVVSEDKKKVVAELKKAAKKAKTIWIASDEDREGEAIGWHLMEVLGLSPDSTNRIVFHEITKSAITKAIESPRLLDLNLVDAQQARRILDRLVGFEISPVLWKKVKPSLSAGRVQSVAVRLIVDQERDIQKFKPTSAFRVTSVFDTEDPKRGKAELKAELGTRFKTHGETQEFLEKCNGANFHIDSIVKKPAKKSPTPPFITSTLQQEASRKLGFPVSMTMSVAQKLYEAGKITYMRTDSTNLSQLALDASKDAIVDKYGENYHHLRTFKTKAKGAQEAHEAIRPTYMNQSTVDGTPQEQKLYELIWKRTIASQMADAKLERTTVKIGFSGSDELFIATGEVLVFDGFLSVYLESTDDETQENSIHKGLLPPLSEGQDLIPKEIVGTQRFSQKPPRFTEASLVRKLEEQGIGRPSTYAPTITTIQNRNYIVKEDREGVVREYQMLTLKNGGIHSETCTEITGAERGKLFPTDIGLVVNDFLVKNFDSIVDYKFTAKVEKEFDEIAEGKRVWTEMIDEFYVPFHEIIEDVIENSERSTGERQLGIDPKTEKPVSVRIGRYGPMAQLGVTQEDSEEKPQFASLRHGQSIETITLEDALDLFKLPRQLGEYEDKVVTVAVGRFGPYVRHDSKFVSLKKDVDDPLSIELDRAVELIEEKREKDRKALLRTFDEDPDLRVIQGRWGPYIAYQKANYKIPKDTVVEELTFEGCMKVVEEGPKPKKGAAKKTTAKKTATKKAAPKKAAPKKAATKSTVKKTATKKKPTTDKK
ncbi:type I DNA topoisomerase [Halosquirtibacter xylanolyticus]|uniref:type I DNA topoisomerase n=1 Tax=Halosquirtibacter xylanolyticus TaxID=3374599 RepID=UPI0037487B41|nr:type I DNA topoisomerase [Prolixibacteraceae bacterium]